MTESSPLNHYVYIQQTWTISKEKLQEMALFAEEGRNFDSEKKEVATMPNVKHFLQISSDMKEEDAQFYLFLYLYGAAKHYRIHGKFSFFVKSANYYTQHDDVFEQWMGWGYTICHIDEFFCPKRNFIVDDKFTVEMKGIFIVEVDEMPKVVVESAVVGPGLWKSNGKDFKIVVGDEGDVMIHKIVLALRSSYFEGLFRSGMKESITNSVNIIDFNLKTVKAAVEFFYDLNVFESLNLDDALELLRFADKYRIADLQDKLEMHLTYQLSSSTVCKTANGSIYANSPKLRQICFDFLMTCSRHLISVSDREILDKEFAAELFQKTFSSSFD